MAKENKKGRGKEKSELQWCLNKKGREKKKNLWAIVIWKETGAYN